MRRVLITLSAVLVIGSLGLSQVLPPGVPRAETLIVHSLFAPAPIPGNWNLWAGWRQQNNGLHQFATEALWTLNPNVVEGGIINALAAEPPIYNEDSTQLTIRLREGVYWSDGVPFTAHDVVFTVLATRETPALAFHSQMLEVKEAYAADDHTVVIELTRPNTRFHTAFLERWSTLRPMPKHIFSQVEDIMAFDFHPPLSLGPYVYVNHDPAGNWVLWSKREDWQRTVTGMLFGEPAPQYVLFINYGPPESHILAMLGRELDVFQGPVEAMLTLLERSDTTRSFREAWPFIDPRDLSTRGPGFNHLREPFDNRDVRWALALAIDAVEVAVMAYDGMVALTPGLPLMVLPEFDEWYFERLEPWLEEFTLDLGDGRVFQPWDGELPWRLLEWAQQHHEVDLDPTDVDAVRLTLGYGWWKHAPDVAEELLTRHGFSRDPGGRWLLPNGELWRIQYLSGTDPSDMAYIVGLAVMEQWREFGITVDHVPSAVAGHLTWHGEFEVSAASHGGWVGEVWGVHPDLHIGFLSLRSDLVRPIGEPTLGWAQRWSDPRMDELIRELELTPWDDLDRIIELGLAGMKLQIEEMIAIPIINCPIVIVFDESYWTNFTSPANDYARSDNFTTWPQLKYILHHLEPTGR